MEDYAWGGEAEIQGAGLVREILNYIFIKKTVWWGRIWFISHCDLYL